MQIRDSGMEKVATGIGTKILVHKPSICLSNSRLRESQFN